MADPTLVVRVAANLSEFKSNLAEGIDQVETYKSALSRASAAFDGSRIVQQASAAAAAIQNAGGVSALTASEQAKANAIFTDAADKLQLMGKGGTYAAQQFKDLAEATKHNNEGFGQFESLIERITERFAIYEVLRSAFDFSKEVIEDTARIEVLSLATGISADGIQRLSYVGRQFGIDAEQMARGVEQLSAKLANGDANATKAVEELGLSVQGLMAAGPKEAFLEIAEAVGHVEDPMLKNGLATELFGGKLAKVLIPALGELRQKMEEVPKDSIISDANVKAAHEFEVGLGNLKVKAEAWGAWILGGLSTYEKWLEKQSGVTDSTDMLGRSIEKTSGDVALQTETVQTAVTAADLLANRLRALRAEAMEPLSDTQKASIVELESYGVSHKEIAQLIGSTEIAVKRYTDAVKVSGEEAKKAAATAAAAALETTKLWDEYDAVRVQHSGTATDVQVAQIDKWAADLTAKMQAAGRDTADFYDALEALSAEKMAAIGSHWSTLVTTSREALDQIAARAWKDYDDMVNSSLHFSRAAIQAQRDVAQAAQDAANNWQNATEGAAKGTDTWREATDKWNASVMNGAASVQTLAGAWISAAEAKKAFDAGNTLDIGHAAQDPRIMAFLKAGWSLANAEALKQGEDWGFSPKLYDALGNPETAPSKGERVPGYEGGVKDAPGGWAMVGERGPELMRVPRGADIYPTGTGPGGTQTINLVVDGKVLASVMADHTMQRQRNIGVRF